MIDYVYLFLAVFLYFYAVMRFSRLNFKWMSFSLYMLVVFIAIVIMYQFNASFARVLIIVAAFVIQKYYGSSWLRSVLVSIVAFIVMTIGDFAVSYLYVFVLKVDFNSLTELRTRPSSIPVTIGVSVATTYILSIITYYIVDRFVKKNQQTGSLKYTGLLFMLSLVTLLGIFLQLTEGSNDQSGVIVSGTVVLIYFIAFVVLGFFGLTTYVQEIRQESERIQQEQLNSYTVNLEENTMLLRKFRHDYINMMTSLEGFIDNNDMEGLKVFYETSLKEESQMIIEDKNEFSKIAMIKLAPIKGIVANKITSAINAGIKVSLDIVDEIDFVNMNMVDLVRMLGIMLDNAIEAQEGCNHKEIGFGILKNESSITIIVENAVCKDIPKIFQMFKEGFSTKGEGRGIGMSNLRELTDKNPSVFLDTSAEDEKFVHKVEIMNN